MSFADGVHPAVYVEVVDEDGSFFATCGDCGWDAAECRATREGAERDGIGHRCCAACCSDPEAHDLHVCGKEQFA